MILIGPAASAGDLAAIKAVIASLTLPRLHTGEQSSDETVLGPGSTCGERTIGALGLDW